MTLIAWLINYELNKYINTRSKSQIRGGGGGEA